MPHRVTILATGQIYHIFNRGINSSPIFGSPREYSRFLELIKYYRFYSINLSYSHFKRLKGGIREEFLKNLITKKQYRVDILAFCLMPNHFHLLLHQLKDNGISKMLADVQNGYARYFNLRNKRLGPLFQSVFKAVRVETEEQLLHTSRYIHLNPVTSYLVEPNELEVYRWSSFSDYIKPNTETFISKPRKPQLLAVNELAHERSLKTANNSQLAVKLRRYHGLRPWSFISSRLILDLIGKTEKYRNFVLDQADYQRELAKIKHLTLENT